MMYMRKLQLSTKLKGYFSIAFILFAVLFLASLFIFKDNLTEIASNLVIKNAGSEVKSSESAKIDSLYNYSKSGLPYKYTFLEFGAKGCSACKMMESVMEEIKLNNKNIVNVIFMNVRNQEYEKLLNYYGVVMIPTQIVLDRNAVEIFRHTGYIPANELQRVFN